MIYYSQPIDEEFVEDEHEVFEGYEPNFCFITHPLFLTLKSTKEDWRRQNIFSTTRHIHGQPAKLIIGPATSEKIVAQKVVKSLKLKTELHPHPYKLAWLAIITSVKVVKRFLPTFVMGSFKDEVLYDVVVVDTCHLTFG